jgi:hypothetical protein
MFVDYDPQVDHRVVPGSLSQVHLASFYLLVGLSPYCTASYCASCAISALLQVWESLLQSGQLLEGSITMPIAWLPRSGKSSCHSVSDGPVLLAG